MSGESQVGQVLAIAGCTNSGKTTIADALKEMVSFDSGAKYTHPFQLTGRHRSVEIIHQDDFFMEKEKVNNVQSADLL